MRLYLWNTVSPVSSYLHDGGRVVAIASSLEEARAQWVDRAKEYGLYDNTALDAAPDDTINIAGDKESRIWVFPKAGCC